MHKQLVFEKSKESFFGTGIRCWLGNLSFEIYPFTKSFSFEICMSDDYEYTIHLNLCIPLLFSFYTGYDNKRLLDSKAMRKFVGYKYGSRLTGFRFFDWALWIDFYKSQHHSGRRWSGYSSVFHVDDFFLGKTTYHNTIVNSGDIDFFVEKGEVYSGKWKKMISTHERSRWFDKEVVMYELSVEDGVRTPGKGTSEHNCGEDAVYSLKGHYDCLDSIIKSFIKEVRYRRENYPL